MKLVPVFGNYLHLPTGKLLCMYIIFSLFFPTAGKMPSFGLTISPGFGQLWSNLDGNRHVFPAFFTNHVGYRNIFSIFRRTYTLRFDLDVMSPSLSENVQNPIIYSWIIFAFGLKFCLFRCLLETPPHKKTRN